MSFYEKWIENKNTEVEKKYIEDFLKIAPESTEVAGLPLSIVVQCGMVLLVFRLLWCWDKGQHSDRLAASKYSNPANHFGTDLVQFLKLLQLQL